MRRIIIIIALLSCIPFLWTYGIISGGDVFFPVNFLNLVHIYVNMWNYQIYLGIPSATYINTIFPYFAIGSFLQMLGIPAVIIQKIGLTLLFFISGFSMYYLLSHILNEKYKNIIFIPTIFYMFNPFFMVLLNPPNTGALLGYALTPLLLALFMEGLKKCHIKYAVFIGLVSLFLMSTGMNPPVYIVTWLPVGLYLLWDLVYHSFTNFWKKIRFAIYVGAIILSLNLFWLISIFTNISANVDSSKNWVGFTSAFANPSNVFRLLGSWAFTQRAFDSPYFPFAGWYYTPLAVLTGMALLIILLLGFLNKKYLRDKNFTFLSLLFITSIFMAKGPNPPFGEGYLWLFQNVPFFWILRDPWAKFMPLVVLSYVTLFAYSVGFIYEKLKLSKAFLAIVVILIFVNSWPIFTGDVIPGERGNFPSMRISEVPSYWFEASDYINNLASDSRVLLLPANPFYQVHYFWPGDGYYGADPAPYFIFKPLVSVDPGGGYTKPVYSDEIAQSIYSKIEKNETHNIDKYLQLVNVRYALERKDVDWTHLNTTNTSEPKDIKNALASYFTLEKSFGSFDLGKIKTDQYFLNEIVERYSYILNESVLDVYSLPDPLPHIFTAATPLLINGGVNDMGEVVTSDEFPSGKFAIFLSEQQDGEQMQFIKNRNDTVMVGYTEKIFNTTVGDAYHEPFSWCDGILPWSNLSDGKFVARFYSGAKAVVRTDGREIWDTLSLPSAESAPYKFLDYNPSIWNAYNSTLIFIKTNKPLILSAVYAGGRRADVIGVWWESGCVGTGEPINYPISIPENQRTIIQISNKSKNVSISLHELSNLSLLSNYKNDTPEVVFQKINPTEYKVHIKNANHPFFLIFSESYNPGWKAYISDEKLGGNVLEEYYNVNVSELKQKDEFVTTEDLARIFEKPLNEEDHFLVGGYANGWYIDKNGDYTVTIQFEPQIWFYYALLVSLVSLILSLAYLAYNWLKERGSL